MRGGCAARQLAHTEGLTAWVGTPPLHALWPSSPGTTLPCQVERRAASLVWGQNCPKGASSVLARCAYTLLFFFNSVDHNKFGNSI